MTDDYGCKVCGKHFEEEADLKSHGKDDHPEVNEAYPEVFDKKEEQPAEEIDQQEDKPVQTHDDWQKELEGLQDEFATEQEKCAICDGEHPTSEHPVLEEGGAGSGPQGGTPALLPEQSAMKNINPDYDPFKATPKSQLMQTDPYVSRTTEQGDSSGADDPLAKVADLAENYKYMSRDHRISLFESLDFTQGDSAILSGLEWNELTRPIKVEASEAYIKEQEEPEEEAEETEEDEENKAYESLYNIEKYHTSPNYKKKAITCNRCNEAFYNINDRNIHFNDVHATEQEYKLPETCPYCNIEIHEPDNLDWHMQEEHGAHVPSQFTQTGVQGAMADTDFDSLESHKKANETSIYGSTIDDHFKEEYVMDQDGMYKCEHCGAWLDVHNIGGFSPEEVAKHHLETEHGITESKKKAKEVEEGNPDDWEPHIDDEGNFIFRKKEKAKEDRKEDADSGAFDSALSDQYNADAEPQYGGLTGRRTQSSPAPSGINQNDPFQSPDDVWTAGGQKANEEDVLVDDSGEELDWFKEFGDSYTDGNQTLVDTNTPEQFGDALKKEGMNWNEGKQQYDYESYGDDLKKERDELAKFINMASIENPMNIYGDQKRLEELDAIIDSIATEEEPEEDLVIDTDEDLYALHKGLMDKPIEGEEEMPEWFKDPEQKEEAEKANIERVKAMQAEEEDVELVPDKGEFLNMMRDTQAPPEKAEEDDDEEDEDDNEDYPEGWDKRKPTIGGYDPELDYDG